MQEWESEFLGHVGKLKELVHKTITADKFGDQVSEIKQQYLALINTLFDSGHAKVRRLNKSLAFLHQELDAAKGKFKVGDFVNVKNSSSESHGPSD